MYLVSPTGRNVVANDPYFMNPYVDMERRAHDRDTMFELLATGELGSFKNAASAYDVKYFVTTGTTVLPTPLSGSFELVLITPAYTIYKIPV